MAMTPRGEAQPIPMSPRLVQTLGRAAEYARAQSHVEVALEHVLLALSEDEDAGAILAATGVDIVGLKTDVSGHLGRIETRMPEGHPGTSAISVELREVLQAAAKAARQSRRGDIDGAIVLCAIVGHGQSNAAALLRLHGLTFEEAIRVLQERMRATVPPATAPPAPVASAPAADAESSGRTESTAEATIAEARSRIEMRKASRHSDGREPPAAVDSDGGRPTVGPEEVSAAGQSPVDPPQSEPSREPAPPVVPAPKPSEPAPQAPSVAVQAPPQNTGIGGEPAAGPAEPVPHRPAPPAFPSQQPAAPPQSWTPPPGSPAGGPGAGAAPARPYRVPPPPPPPESGLTPPHLAEPRPPRAEPTMSAPPWAPPPGPAPVLVPRQVGVPIGGPSGLPPLEDVMPTGSAPGIPEAQDPRGAPPSARTGAAPGFAAPAAPPPTAAGQPAPALPPERSRKRKRSPSAAVENGQLVENIPRFMRVGIPSVVEVRIAKAEVKAVAEGLDGGGAAYRHDVMVTKAMSVRLRAPDGGFFIETASPETQWIDSALGLFADDFASWRWTVTPKERGRRRLQLVVSARTVGADGLVAETALPDQIVEVRVRTNYARSLARWTGWILAAVVGGVFARFGEDMFAVALPLVTKLINP